ncbi:MAG: pentapeptide repeat-containing protein [Flavisolibacter sp.]
MGTGKDYSNKNLQKFSFRNADLQYAGFAGSDLRGADFSGSNLTGADLQHVKTGITPLNMLWIFLVALIISAVSGYVAMLSGRTVQQMFATHDEKIRAAGFIAIVLTILFILISYFRGVGSGIRDLVIPVAALALVMAVAAYFSGMGTGKGMLYLVLTLILVSIMFIVGTVARAAAASLSNILFIIVAVSGSVFGKSLGGEVGTLVMAIACALISKKALTGAKGFESLRKIAHYITSRFGTSFRNSQLGEADFSSAKIRNADFSEANLSQVHWGDAKKLNCLISENKLEVTETNAL